MIGIDEGRLHVRQTDIASLLLAEVSQMWPGTLAPSCFQQEALLYLQQQQQQQLKGVAACRLQSILRASGWPASPAADWRLPALGGPSTAGAAAAHDAPHSAACRAFSTSAAHAERRYSSGTASPSGGDSPPGGGARRCGGLLGRHRRHQGLHAEPTCEPFHGICF